MSDFESKLRWLSERGNPVGAEELVERIKADLAGDPLVVVAKRREGTIMTKTQQRPITKPPSRYRGPAWGVAVFAAILTVAGLYFAFGDDPNHVADNSQTMTDLEVIEAGVGALYSGDVERAVELFEIKDGDDDQIRDDDHTRQEAAYQAAIGGRLILNCTEETTPGVFTCNVPYHNAITDAVGYVDSPGDTNRVVVEDGVITEFHVPEHSFLLIELGIFLEEQVGGHESCVDDLRTPECAGLIMDHLDEWAAWCGRIVLVPPFGSRCERE